MSGLELLLLAGGVAFYILSFLAGLFPSRTGTASSLLITGLILHAASAGVRWYGIGHPPIFGTYEAALACSWFMLLYTASSSGSIHGHFRMLLTTTIPLAVLIVLYGLNYNTERIPLTISERSLWVDFHALFSWLAFGNYAIAACLGGVYLWQGARSASLLTPHSSLDVVDDLIFRYINHGFINHTVMFALGSYYSSILFGVWWQWDMVNSLSLITWLSYGLTIHMRLFYGWREERGANLAVIAFLTAIVSYWGLIFFPPGSSYHVFDIEFRTH